LRPTVAGDLPHFQSFYDGATAPAPDSRGNLHAAAKAPGTMDEMPPFVMEGAGIGFASADFLAGNPYAGLAKGSAQAVEFGPGLKTRPGGGGEAMQATRRPLRVKPLSKCLPALAPAGLAAGCAPSQPPAVAHGGHGGPAVWGRGAGRFPGPRGTMAFRR
jgi:hypothetical protein